MELNYCTVCYRETAGSELYCSDTCRLHDTPEEMKTPVSSLVTAPVSPTGDSGFAAAKRMGFRFRNYSGSSSDDEEDSSPNEFVLPATRNVIYGNGAMAAQGTTANRNYFNNNNNGATHNHNITHKQQNQRAANLGGGGGMRMLGRNQDDDDFLDAEATIFAALAKPTSIEHRAKEREKEQNRMAKYVFKKEFPSAF